MKLDARKGKYDGWTVYHVRRCVVLRGVLWVDSDARQWFQYEMPLRLVDGEPYGAIHDAGHIVIDPARRLVLIDPVDDEDDTEGALRALIVYSVERSR